MILFLAQLHNHEITFVAIDDELAISRHLRVVLCNFVYRCWDIHLIEHIRELLPTIATENVDRREIRFYVGRECLPVMNEYEERELCMSTPSKKVVYIAIGFA